MVPQEYRPILKSKRGEMRALANLDERVKKLTRPILEVYVNREPEADTPAEPFPSLRDTVANWLSTHWGTRPLFLDADEVKDYYGIAEARDLLASLDARGSLFIPVCRLSDDRQYLDQLIPFTRQRGLCVRLNGEDAANPNLLNALNDISSVADISAEQIDIVIDFESIDGLKQGAIILAAEAAIQIVTQWAPRSITWAASAFPTSLGGIARHSEGYIERAEWVIYKELLRRASQAREVYFGDYAIQHPILPPFDPRIMDPSAAIRYTVGDNWLILRGESFKRSGSQFRDLATHLVARSDYMSPDHCKGCGQILDIANGSIKPGNLETWRFIGTVHHITVASELESELPSAAVGA